MQGHCACACASSVCYTCSSHAIHLFCCAVRMWLRLQAIRFFPISEEYLPNQWSPFSILEVFNGDKLLLR